LFGRCVSADAAADFAAALDFGSLSTLAAADAAFALVTSLFPAMIISSFPSSPPESDQRHSHYPTSALDMSSASTARLIFQAKGLETLEISTRRRIF
jgi:hypothetical protein